MAVRVKLPAPPADISSRKLPLLRIRGCLYRIHRSEQHWRFFGKSISERFDDPLGYFGVLYCSTRPEAAFAEVFLRHLSLMVVAEHDLLARSLTSFNVTSLKCVDLTGAGLRKLSCDNRISTDTPYKTVGLWSRAFYMHPQRPDGIIYRTRHNPRFRCLALFDRCGPKLAEDATLSLMGPSWRAWTADQLTKYNLALV